VSCATETPFEHGEVVGWNEVAYAEVFGCLSFDNIKVSGSLQNKKFIPNDYLLFYMLLRLG
jgi:hypothetical protein